MKREDVTGIFPNATDEEIDSILNKVGEELNPLKKQFADEQKARETAEGDLEKVRVSEAGLKAELEKVNEKLEADMTAEERIAAREKAAEEREAEFTLRTNQLEAKAIFVEAGCFDADEIDDLVAQVSNGDLDVTKANAKRIVDTVNKQREAVEKATKNELLKGNPKIDDLGGGEATMKKSEFKALPIEKQIEMKQANPDIISQLTEG